MNSDTSYPNNCKFKDDNSCPVNNSSTNHSIITDGLFCLKKENRKITNFFEPFEDEKENMNDEFIYDKKIDELLSKELVNKLITISPLPPQDLSKKKVIIENLMQEKEESISQKSGDDSSSVNEEEESDSSDIENISNKKQKNKNKIEGGKENKKICEFFEFDKKKDNNDEKEKHVPDREKNGINRNFSFFGSNGETKNNITQGGDEISSIFDKNKENLKKEAYDFNITPVNFFGLNNRQNLQYNAQIFKEESNNNINNNKITSKNENNYNILNIPFDKEKEFKFYKKEGEEKKNLETKNKNEGIIYNLKNENLFNNQPFFPKNHFNNANENKEYMKNGEKQEKNFENNGQKISFGCEKNSNSQQYFLNNNNDFYYLKNNNFPNVNNNFNQNTVNIYHINTFYNIPEFGQKTQKEEDLKKDEANFTENRTNFSTKENPNDNQNINNMIINSIFVINKY